MIRRGVMIVLGIGIVGCVIFLYQTQGQLKSQAQQAEEYSVMADGFDRKILEAEEKVSKYDRIIKISKRKIESYLRTLDACQN